jgi:hypothetical protein
MFRPRDGLGQPKRILLELSMHRASVVFVIFSPLPILGEEIRLARARVRYTMQNRSWKISNNN